MVERKRAPDSSSVVSIQQSVVSNPSRDTCVLVAASFGWDVKPVVQCVL